MARDDIDLYALTHNETSTGVMMPIRRPEGAALPADGGGLVAVDATSGAGGLPVDPTEFDAYYFAPQKCFGSDGGLWVALLSPAAVERIGTHRRPGRWVPASMDLTIALDNSRLDQTYNTPALATLFLFDDQVRWFNDNGGLDVLGRPQRPLGRDPLHLGRGVRLRHPVRRPASRTAATSSAPSTSTTSIDAAQVAAVLRANGIVDTEPYRKLGRNQLRIAMFPAIDPEDVAALCGCITHVVGALAQ